MIKTQIAEVLNQEMNRKEFLRYAGVAVLMLAGGGAIMQAVGAVGRPKTSSVSRVPSSYGYGASAYGGSSHIS